jgi:hypothetical protein
MERHDERGLPISCGSQASLTGYERALVLLQSYSADPLATIDAVLERDPEFLLGHALRAGLFVVGTERRGADELARSVRAAEALIARGAGTARERAHVAAARAWLDGNFGEAGDRYHRLTLDHPRDVLAVQLGHLCNFYLGRAAGLCDHVAAVLPHYSPDDRCYGYLQGMLAFGLEENERYELAEAAGWCALDHDRRDPWAIHALAHCAEMQGRVADGIALYTGRERDWAEGSFFAVHNHWHLALFHLDRGDTASVLGMYDAAIRAGSSEVVLDLVDASALLWRLGLLGAPLGERWQPLADTWQRVAEEGYYAFNDLHAMMAFAAAGRRDAVERVLAGLERAAREDGTNAVMARSVALPACRGFEAFACGDHRGAIAALAGLPPIARLIGGSNAQRDIIDWTLLEASLRAGDDARARALAEARLARKPNAGLAGHYHARASTPSGRAGQPRRGGGPLPRAVA